MLKIKVTKEIDIQDIYDEADADIDMYEEEELEGEKIPHEEYYPGCVEQAMDYYVREYRAQDEYQLSDLIVENYDTIKKFILDKLYKDRGPKGQRDVTESNKPNGKNRIIWDEVNTPMDRRPTVAADIDNDIHVVDFTEPDWVFDKLAEIFGNDPDEEYVELTNDEKLDLSQGELCKLLLDKYGISDEDPGDVSPTILYVVVDGEVIVNNPYYCLESKDLSTISEDEVKNILKATLDN